tara:strand:- start:222 stop:1052 length:831 start_codon:yes stop_codon:yes gene_type:complete
MFVMIYTLINQLFYEQFSFFQTNFDFIIFFIALLIFFLIGFIDDKKNISANIRFVIIALILIPTIIFSDNLIINYIEFSFTEYSFYLPYYTSIFWTILCFLLFINAINMFDGINYQVGLYFIYLSLFFLVINHFNLFFSSVLIGLITFIILNHKFKSFLGDSGSYLLAFIFGYFFIKIYNQTEIIKVDHIFLFMIIPGIDLIRLFLMRILKNQNPFIADRNHLHHIVSKRFNLITTNLFIQSIIIGPSILGYYFGFTYFFLFVQMIIYFYLIFFIR